MQDQLGATEFWGGPMAAVVTRKAKVLKIIEAATFTVLTMQFPAGSTGPTPMNPNTVTFPSLYELRDVASFQLASGVIQAIYNV